MMKNNLKDFPFPFSFVVPPQKKNIIIFCEKFKRKENETNKNK